MSENGDVTDQWAAQVSALVSELSSAPDPAISVGFGDVTVTVSPAQWTDAALLLRDRAHLTFFDWLSAVDEGDRTFSVFCHLFDPVEVRHALLHTELAQGAPVLDTMTGVFRGASWHERETAEMFGIEFTGHPHLARLLLSDEFDGAPLRKDFVLTARVSKSWPGAKEPGESGDGSPSRRKMQPPGVAAPEWGPHEQGERGNRDE